MLLSNSPKASQSVPLESRLVVNMSSTTMLGSAPAVSSSLRTQRSGGVSFRQAAGARTCAAACLARGNHGTHHLPPSSPHCRLREPPLCAPDAGSRLCRILE